MVPVTLEVLGLCGYARVGKDTAAANLPVPFHRFAFADALKRDLSPLLAQVGCDLTIPSDKERARPLLVAWGATARAFAPDHWIRRTFEEIREYAAREYLEGRPARVVVTDIRYPNECAAILALGGRVVYVSRHGFGPANEEEEGSIAAIRRDYPLPWVVNNGTPADLGTAVYAAFLEWGTRGW